MICAVIRYRSVLILVLTPMKEGDHLSSIIIMIKRMFWMTSARALKYLLPSKMHITHTLIITIRISTWASITKSKKKWLKNLRNTRLNQMNQRTRRIIIIPSARVIKGVMLFHTHQLLLKYLQFQLTHLPCSRSHISCCSNIGRPEKQRTTIQLSALTVSTQIASPSLNQMLFQARSWEVHCIRWQGARTQSLNTPDIQINQRRSHKLPEARAISAKAMKKSRIKPINSATNMRSILKSWRISLRLGINKLPNYVTTSNQLRKEQRSFPKIWSLKSRELLKASNRQLKKVRWDPKQKNIPWKWAKSCKVRSGLRKSKQSYSPSWIRKQEIMPN